MSILVLFCSSVVLTAQINVKIGYKSGYGDFNLNNQLLSSFVPSNGELRDGFSALHVLHGIEMGLRYKTGNLAWEIGWESFGRDRSALVYHPANENFSSRKYNYAIRGFYAGVDSYYGQWGVGASVHRKKLAIRREIDSNNLDLVGQTDTNLQFHVTWVVQQSERVSFVLKPYYQFSLGSFDLANLADDLSVPDDGTGFKDDLNIFGLSFIFYNGPQ